jgi:hypothetical protein
MGSKVLRCAQRARNPEGGLDGSGGTPIGENPQRSAVLRSAPTTSARGGASHCTRCDERLLLDLYSIQLVMIKRYLK